ncbi:24438_t:CDS:2, partial [Dentiscutata erythropus]
LLPETPEGYHYIVVATDYLIKWPEVHALKSADAESVASFLLDDIICHHGSPRELLFDQDWWKDLIGLFVKYWPNVLDNMMGNGLNLSQWLCSLIELPVYGHDAILSVKTVVITYPAEPTTEAETQDYLF